jgi:hypothetical protein
MQRGCNYSDIISVANESHEPPAPATVGPGDSIVLPDKDILGGKYMEKPPADCSNRSGGSTGGGRCYSMSGDSRLGFA